MVTEGAQDDVMVFRRDNDILRKLISKHLRHANVYLLEDLSVSSVGRRRLKDKPQHTVIKVEITVPSDDPTPETVSEPLFDDIFKKVGIWCKRYFPNAKVQFMATDGKMEWYNNPNRWLDQRKISAFSMYDI